MEQNKKVKLNIFSRFYRYCKDKFDSRTIKNAKYYQDWNLIKWRYRSFKFLYLSFTVAAFQFLLYIKPKEKFVEEFQNLNNEIEKYFNIKEKPQTFQENFKKLCKVNQLFLVLTLYEKNSSITLQKNEVKFITYLYNHLMQYNNDNPFSVANNLNIMEIGKNPKFSSDENDLSDSLYKSVR